MQQAGDSVQDQTPDDEAETNAALSDYRRFLVEGAQQSQSSLDKALLTLSGGALGISVIFIKDIIGEQHVVSLWALIASWGVWSASVLCVLASFDFASRANRVAIARCDDGTIHEHAEAPGGVFSYLTRGFNVGAALTFVLGVALMLAFVHGNLTERNKRYEQQRQAHSATAATSDSTPDPTTSTPAPNSQGRRSARDSGQGIRPASAPAKEEVTASLEE